MYVYTYIYIYIASCGSAVRLYQGSPRAAVPLQESIRREWLYHQGTRVQLGPPYLKPPSRAQQPAQRELRQRRPRDAVAALVEEDRAHDVHENWRVLQRVLLPQLKED